MLKNIYRMYNELQINISILLTQSILKNSTSSQDRNRETDQIYPSNWNNYNKMYD